MTGTQTLIAILAVAASIGGTSIARAWIADRTHARQIDHQRRQLDDEMERFELLIGSIDTSVRRAFEGLSNPRK